MSLEFHNAKKSKNKTLILRTISVILGLLIILVAKGAVGAYFKERDSALKLDQAMRDLEKTESRTENLTKDIKKLETDVGVEATIREKFGVAKEGESVIVVLDADSSDGSVVEVKKTWWKRMFSWW